MRKKRTPANAVSRRNKAKEAKQAMEVEQEEAEIPVNKVAPPQVRLTRRSEWSRSDF